MIVYLLDGVLHNIPYHRHFSLLTESKSASDRLGFYSGVEVRFDEMDTVCLGEVEAVRSVSDDCG